MLNAFNTDGYDNTKDFQQRVAGQNMQSIEERQDEIQHAKNGFIGMLAGIIVGGVVGWLFLGPTDNQGKEKEIPIVRRSITPAKVQPNDPGGMEIGNQDREIYHIVDKLPKATEEVNIIPAPEMPKIIVENTISTPENIENLVESIEEESNVITSAEIKDTLDEETKVAATDLTAVKTNSSDKVVIPEKIKDVEIKLQKSINSQAGTVGVVDKEEKKTEEPKVEKKETETPAPTKPVAVKGTWYAQIIASSSRKSVETLWTQLSAKHTFLKSYSHEVEEITAANGSTLYRLKVGAFKTRKEAENLSEKLKQNQISSIIKQN